MSTAVNPIEARAAVNRANSLHSTGPVTEAGRAAVRFNAFKTGLYAKTLVIPGEDPADFEALGASLTEVYKPTTVIQRTLVRVLQETEWRIARVTVIENNLYTIGMVDYLDEVEPKYGPQDEGVRHALAQCMAFQANARLFEQIARQEARLRRLYDKTVKELESQTATEPAAAPKQETGFVPPKPATTLAPKAKYPDMPKFTGSFADRHRNEWIRKHGKKT